MRLGDFEITCLFCSEKEKIQCDATGDDGYSDYTVEESGQLYFKCLECGTYGNSDEYDEEGSNKSDMFEIKCLKCGKTETLKNTGVNSNGIDYCPNNVDCDEDDLNELICGCGNIWGWKE